MLALSFAGSLISKCSLDIFDINTNTAINAKRNTASKGLAKIHAHAIISKNVIKLNKKANNIKITAPTAPIMGIYPMSNIIG